VPLCAETTGARQPDIVFLLADDLGWSDLGCYGSTFHETPMLDQFAREGTKFNSFYATGPVCSPTRASIMTGKYPPRTGITDWLRAGRSKRSTTRNALALEELTVAEAFKEAGYQTLYAGKWHLGFEGFGPTQQGFDEYVEPSEATKNESRSRKRKRKSKSGKRA
jgi:arylsulfatase A-like enzyme